MQLIAVTADSPVDTSSSHKIQAWRDTLLTQAGAISPVSPAAQASDHVTLRAIVIGAVLAIALFSAVAKLVLN